MKTTETANKATEVNNENVKAAENKAAATATNGKTAANTNGKQVNGKGAAANGKAAATKKTEAAVKAAPKAEPTKAELRAQLAEQPPAMNLTETIKLVEELHRKKRQLDRLIATIDELEYFEIKQLDEEDAAASGIFQRCQLTIEDDREGEFSTKNPFIINAVAQYVKGLCENKRVEIESEIYIPR